MASRGSRWSWAQAGPPSLRAWPQEPPGYALAPEKSLTKRRRSQKSRIALPQHRNVCRCPCTPHALSLRSDRSTDLDRRHIMNPNRCSLRGGFPGALATSAASYKPMESAAIKLDPRTVEAIARRVVDLLERRGLGKRELVDAAELARRFGIERSWVYTHAIELGAVKLGNGAKPRLRFDPEVAARVLRRVGGEPAADPPARSGKRAGQPRGSEGRVGLLPIRGRGESGPPSAA